MTEWFEQWFGEEYLRLYPHRDEAEAEQAIALVDRAVPLPGRTVLDLACGPGRHAARLAARGARVVGLDLSLALLTRARRHLGDTVPLVRADMRLLPFAAASFDLVLNLFTSFGYFTNDAQHAAVIGEIGRLLQPGGTFVIDYLNAEHVRSTLVPHEERAVGTHRVGIERRISDDGRYVIKEMHLMDDGRSFLERVRLFTPDVLVRMLETSGFTLRARYGDYAGAAFAPDSPRLILMGEHA